ncbi:MAG: hypothetical protein WCT20_03090 [Candidatus Babeliales bacterium]
MLHTRKLLSFFLPCFFCTTADIEASQVQGETEVALIFNTLTGTRGKPLVTARVKDDNNWSLNEFLKGITHQAELPENLKAIISSPDAVFILGDRVLNRSANNVAERCRKEDSSEIQVGLRRIPGQPSNQFLQDQMQQHCESVGLKDLLSNFLFKEHPGLSVAAAATLITWIIAYLLIKDDSDVTSEPEKFKERVMVLVKKYPKTIRVIVVSLSAIAIALGAYYDHITIDQRWNHCAHLVD